MVPPCQSPPRQASAHAIDDSHHLAEAAKREGPAHGTMSTLAEPRSRVGNGDILGHPRGLFYLTFTETWERFSYYGMTALLTLYMVEWLFLPARLVHIAGFTELRATLESLSGPLSTQALASQIFGLYTGLVYFTPMLGGMLADRWIGQRNAVVLGALSMSAGHIAMAFERSFLLALVLLVIGSGLLKGNIASQVGGLYQPEDETRRTRGYVIFSTGINIGAVTGPLLCGLLAQLYGWRYGFGIAAIFMLTGLAIYLRGYRFLPARVQQSTHAHERLSAAEWRRAGALLIVILITALQSVSYYQLYNVGPLWTQQHVDLDLGGFGIPSAWYLAVNPLTSILGVPLLLRFWKLQSLRGREPNEVVKIGIGAWLAAASNLFLASTILAFGNSPLGPLWPLPYHIGLGVSFLDYWPTLLALVSRCAPGRLNATLIGVAYVSLFVSNTVIGWIGGFYGYMTPAAFWAMHAAIAASGGLLVVLFGRRLSHVLSDTTCARAAHPGTGP